MEEFPFEEMDALEILLKNNDNDFEKAKSAYFESILEDPTVKFEETKNEKNDKNDNDLLFSVTFKSRMKKLH